jgi:hypothetical protein
VVPRRTAKRKARSVVDPDRWTAAERRFFANLRNPAAIQRFLNSIPYNIDPITRSARGVIEHKRAHCLDGATFAAAALEANGEPPIIIDMRASSDDDDHVLALFRRNGCWGAIAKSNFVTCRYRDPIYRTIRELALSYFDGWFNLAGKKTLREYSGVLDLRKIKDPDWRRSSGDIDPLGFRLDAIRHYRLVNGAQIRSLEPADDLSFRGATLGLDMRGAYKVKNPRK